MAESVKDRVAEMAGWFGPRLKELRTRAGLTQSALAERVGIAQSRIAEYEGVRRFVPNWDTVLGLALALDVSTEAFARPPADPGGSGPGKKSGKRIDTKSA